jgi:hypothetical protein
MPFGRLALLEVERRALRPRYGGDVYERTRVHALTQARVAVLIAALPGASLALDDHEVAPRERYMPVLRPDRDPRLLLRAEGTHFDVAHGLSFDLPMPGIELHDPSDNREVVILQVQV